MTRERRLAGLALIIALAALGTALGTERFGGLVPCALCLVERWPYRIAALLAAIALALPRRLVRPQRVLLWLVAATFAAAAAAAAIHVGVEAGWWPSPLPECAAPSFGGGTIAERLARMPATPAKPCDEPTFLIPGLPLSMAAMNLIAALVSGGLLAAALVRAPRSPA